MPDQLVKTYLPLEDYERERDRAERYRVALERIEETANHPLLNNLEKLATIKTILWSMKQKGGGR